MYFTVTYSSPSMSIDNRYMSPQKTSPLVEDDVAAFEQRIHRIAHDVDRAVAFGEVGDVDEIDGFELRLVAEQRYESRRPLDRIERHALQRQRVVRAVQVGGQVGFGVEHAALARFEPVGVYVQFLNQNVAIARRERRLARFDHRECGFPDPKMLSHLLLRHSELFSYQFYPLIHDNFIRKIDTNN
jgi:hypothetical protein